MNGQDAGVVFGRLSELWPDWNCSSAEREEWMKSIIQVYSKEQGMQAVSEVFADSNFKKPNLRAFRTAAIRIYRQWRVEHKHGFEPSLLFTIARMRGQIGHDFFGKPNQSPQDIETQAMKSLKDCKMLYGGEFVIIYPSEAKPYIPLTPERKDEIDRKIMAGADCPAKMFLLNYYKNLADREQKEFKAAQPKPDDFYPDGERKRYLSDGSLAPKRDKEDGVDFSKEKQNVKNIQTQTIGNAVRDFAEEYKL